MFLETWGIHAAVHRSSGVVGQVLKLYGVQVFWNVSLCSEANGIGQGIEEVSQT